LNSSYGGIVKRITLALAFALTVALSFAACGSGVDKTPVIAVPLPMGLTQSASFLNGIELAREDIAAAGLNITVQADDDKGEFAEAVALAQSYIADDNVIGVVGHWYSDICVPVAELYKNGGKTLVVPTVSTPNLTAKPSRFIFRNIPNDEHVSVSMIEYAERIGAKTSVVYYEDSKYGFRMAAIVEEYAERAGISVLDKVSSPPEREIPSLAVKWEVLGADVVFVVCNVEEGVTAINLLDGGGYAGTFICGDGVDADSTPRLVSPNANVMVCTVADVNSEVDSFAEFKKRYGDKFGEPADVWAAQGYDCVMIIANAIANGVTTSDELSYYLSEASDLGSVYGKTYFDDNHEIAGRGVYNKLIRNGGYEHLS
jgi:branched-chain amino acid transport system substrate-binding protein